MKKIGLLLICCLIKLTSVNAQEKPNIIFLFSDDQTIHTLGAYGNKEIITPNLDKLAGMGVRFTNHYNTTSICMASRACVMTGLYEYRHGTNFGHGDLEKELFQESYTNKLREAGYYTGFVGKTGFNIEGQKFDAFDREFDEFAGGPGQTSYITASNKKLVKYAKEYPHATRANGAWAKDFMKNAKATGKPFCMSVSFKAPHRPTTPDPIDLKRYKGRTKFTKPVNYGVENGEHLSAQSHTSRAALQYRYWMTDYDNTVKDYYALISGVDAAVGMILEGLKELGLEKNTIIIFTSDNGYNCGAHGFAGKVLPYEEGSKSPLLIYDPRLPKKYNSKVSDALTTNVDMAATIIDFSGLSVSNKMDGKSLVPLLKNPKKEIHKSVPLFNFWGVAEAHSMAIVTKEWKYVYWYSESNGMKPIEELFHLKKDAFEMQNVAEKNPNVLAEMKLIYAVELKAMKETLIEGHGYNEYPILFDQNIDWNKKKSLAKNYDGTKDRKKGKPSKKKGNKTKKH
ncbi:sulfatase family protein [Flavicella sediminum]|uniref:sulfatase family protein n=1 Tax=Flavicella sediminum TaxID=2585141 RepID=UPI001408160C|nr:sulfatase [Flavicella sediminum]